MIAKLAAAVTKPKASAWVGAAAPASAAEMRNIKASAA